MPRPKAGTWYLDYIRDEEGTYSVTCPYCAQAMTLPRLSQAVLAGVAHTQTCKERNPE